MHIPGTTLASVSLSGRSEGAVKALRGFRKDRHHVPDAGNATASATTKPTPFHRRNMPGV
jgi:hypothetical protein